VAVVVEEEYRNLALNWIVIKPGTLTSVPEDPQSTWLKNGLEIGSDKRDIAIFAGQSDPQHHDHFTINAIANGTPLVIDGWLTDQDDVDLSLRKSANPTPPAPPSPASSR
jgi:hypothetical protein